MTASDETHRARMARRKAVVDAKIAAANGERGVLLVHTGNGKGKSSAAFGLAARALGHGLRVGVVQFIKGRSDTGEEVLLAGLPGMSWHVAGEGFTWETQDRARDEAAARAGWAHAQALLSDPDVALVVLDELNIVLKLGYLPLDDVLAGLNTRPPMQHVVVTGRGAPAALIELADTVTEMKELKHAFRAGVKSQRGIEW